MLTRFAAMATESWAIPQRGLISMKSSNAPSLVADRISKGSAAARLASKQKPVKDGLMVEPPL